MQLEKQLRKEEKNRNERKRKRHLSERGSCNTTRNLLNSVKKKLNDEKESRWRQTLPTSLSLVGSQQMTPGAEADSGSSSMSSSRRVTMRIRMIQRKIKTRTKMMRKVTTAAKAKTRSSTKGSTLKKGNRQRRQSLSLFRKNQSNRSRHHHKEKMMIPHRTEKDSSLNLLLIPMRSSSLSKKINQSLELDLAVVLQNVWKMIRL